MESIERKLEGLSKCKKAILAWLATLFSHRACKTAVQNHPFKGVLCPVHGGIRIRVWPPGCLYAIDYHLYKYYIRIQLFSPVPGHESARVQNK